MALLTDEQKKRAIEVMQEYMAARDKEDGGPLWDAGLALDEKRRELLGTHLKALVENYLAGNVPLPEFKSRVDGINKRHQHWGFKGIKGQMFFNMTVNVAQDQAECDQELKAAIVVPANEDIARSRIRTFASYIKRLGEQHVEAGGTKHSRPKPGSIPFFLSYFWQVQDWQAWPVFYTNSANTMTDLNLWQPTEDLAEDYITFKHIHEELIGVFTEASGKPYDVYKVEHVFWLQGGNPYGVTKTQGEPPPAGQARTGVTVIESERLSRLPDSYVPPIVSILPRMARRHEDMIQAAKASGTSLERAFEKSINAAFTILGYETKLLGQGQGRVPDGVAVERDSWYAILWDAKCRGEDYSIGTDDRVIREYITTQSRDLKRRQTPRNIYYAVVSGAFADDYDDTVRALKMETDVSEVCLIEAAALAAMVDAKLRDPQQVTLGPDGLQRLFSISGILDAKAVRETLA